MVWFSIGFLVVTGVVLIVMRRPIARGQDLIVGGRMGPTLVVAEGVLLLLIALAILLFHRMGAFAV